MYVNWQGQAVLEAEGRPNQDSDAYEPNPLDCMSCVWRDAILCMLH